MHSKKELIKFMKVDRLSIEVVAAFPRQSYTVKLDVPVGTSVRNAIERSCILDNFEVPAHMLSYGVFGEQCGLDAVLSDGDRVEIYRQLEVDPKVRRRQRATSQKSD